MIRRLYLLMAPVSSTTGLALAFLLIPGLAAAGATLSGSFRAEPYGTLELTTEGEHVIGRAGDGGPCHFDAQREILVGDFEGSVLVAQLTVCQTGDMCPQEQTYPVLGFYDEADSAFVAHVRLHEGCQSPALQKGRFVMVASSKEASEQTDGGPRRGRDMDAAMQANKQGEQLYLEKNFTEAARQFEQSLGYDSEDTNWPAYLGRGSSLLKLGQVKAAIVDLERSKQGNATAAASRDPSILYMLGCAYGQKGDKAKALEYLRQAVKAGYRLHEVIDSDPDLTKALGDEPQFKELVRKSREKKPRGPAGSGNSRP